MAVSRAQISAWLPCPEYPEDRLDMIFDGRDDLSLDDFLGLGLPTDDLLWVLIREAWMSPSRLDSVARDCMARTVSVLGHRTAALGDALDAYLLAYKAREGSFEGLPRSEQALRWIEGATDAERRTALCALWCAVAEARAQGSDHGARSAAWDDARLWQAGLAIIAARERTDDASD